MKSADAIAALSALAHAHRLAIFRLLVEHGPDGLPAGVIADAVGLVPSSLTFHLQHLTRARLLTQRRESRQIFYAADFAAMNGLVGYLTDNCCSGGVCAPQCRPASTESRPNARKLRRDGLDLAARPRLVSK